MLAQGCDIEVRRSDLQAAAAHVRVGREPPVRFSPTKIVSLRRPAKELVISTSLFDVSIPCRGTWDGTVMVDAWYFRRVVMRLPQDETVLLVGIDGRLAVVCDRYRNHMGAVHVWHDAVFRRHFRRFYAKPPDDLPLFKMSLL